MPLPFTDSIAPAKLTGVDAVTFDPLGVAAVLGNFRADLSAARLYVQSDRATFRWPHMSMIGGALTPISTLVQHLAQYDSIHPAVSMCTKDERSISVISNTIFRELRVNVSNLWLRDALGFRPTKDPIPVHGERQGFGKAANDVEIVLVKDVFNQGINPHGQKLTFAMWWRITVINLSGLLTGLLICVGVTFSVLVGDMWAVTLFFLYLLHWLASTLISFTHLINTTCPTVRQDDEIKYAVHERPPDIGGMVIFKGSQYEIETWYRTTLQFRRELFADALHWFWLMTGTLAAIGSVACMVNMRSDFQLAFLGVLFYSSLAELWVTQCARRIQVDVSEAAGRGKVVVLNGNNSRTEAITRATLGAGEEFNAHRLDWVGLKLLPPTPIFIEYQKLLNRLTAEKSAGVDDAVRQFQQDCNVDQLSPKNRVLVERIAQEVKDVMDANDQKVTNISPSLKQPDDNI